MDWDNLEIFANSFILLLVYVGSSWLTYKWTWLREGGHTQLSGDSGWVSEEGGFWGSLLGSLPATSVVAGSAGFCGRLL